MKRLIKLLITCSLLIILIGCKEKHNRIIVISDLHYLSQSLYNNSSYFDEMMKHADAKITAYSDLLLDSLIEDIKDLNVDAIILLGDMSFNGEKISHEELSKRFKELNLPILAIPGNHDLNNIYAREYKGKGYTSTETIGKEEFEGIYNSPYVTKDKESLSYIFKLNDVNLLFLDVNASKTYDKISDNTLKWIKNNINKNEKTIAFSHQNLLTHVLYSQDFLIYNNQEVKDLYKELNIKINFTGHIHLQNISYDDNLIEIATSSMSVSPLQYGIIDIYKDHLEYNTRQVNNDKLQKVASEFFDSKSKLSLSAYTDDMDLISYYVKCNSDFFKGKRDELIYDEEKIEAISSLNNFVGNYLKLMFLEDKKDDNHLSISLEK